MATNPDDPMGGERRIFTDDRYPEMEIVNHGDATFLVMQLDRRSGRYEQVDDFKSYEHMGQERVSPEYAARRAKGYFERMSKMDISGELDNRASELEPEFDDKSTVWDMPVQNGTDVVSAPARDFSDEQVLTPDQVLDMWEKAQAMAEGPEKEALMQQVRKASTELESVAQEVVNSILLS